MSSRIEKCMDKVGNRFLLATVVSRRWEQLVTGGRPMVVARDPRSMQTALREIEEEKLKLNVETSTIERLGEPVEQPVPLEGMEETLVSSVNYADRDDDEDEDDDIEAAADADEDEEEGDEVETAVAKDAGEAVEPEAPKAAATEED